MPFLPKLRYSTQISELTDDLAYCRKHHIHLAPIISKLDEERLRNKTAEKVNKWLWICLYREPSNLTGWKWSGGDYASYMSWADEQPANRKNKYYVGVCWNNCNGWPEGWHDIRPDYTLPFFCFSLTVVREKTWEEALDHCRGHHTDLSSLVSEN